MAASDSEEPLGVSSTVTNYFFVDAALRVAKRGVPTVVLALVAPSWCNWSEPNAC